MRCRGLIASLIALLASALAAASAPASSERAWAVSCSAPDACTAVGDRFDATKGQRSIAARWDGDEWRAQHFPALPGAANDALTAVSCPSAELCFATGWAQAVPAAQQTAFVARWSGHGGWSIEPLPPLPSPWEGWLTSISCSSTTACIAVGSMDDYSHGDWGRSLAYRWDGAAWSLEHPIDVGYPTRFWDVSCASPTFCAAVGLDALIETWDGSRWSVQAPAAPPDAWTFGFSAVSCSAPDACTAVGSYGDSQAWPKTLAERWDGSVWTYQSTPSTQAQNDLNDVSCSAPTACVAVGAGHPLPSLIERWDGQAWAIDQLDPASGSAPLQDVSCSTPMHCMAAGWAITDAGDAHPVFKQFDGTAWTNVSTLVTPPPIDPPPVDPPPVDPPPIDTPPVDTPPRVQPPHIIVVPPTVEIDPPQIVVAPLVTVAPARPQSVRPRRNSAAGACVSIRRWSRTGTAARANARSRAARRCARARARARVGRRCSGCSARSPSRRSRSS